MKRLLNKNNSTLSFLGMLLMSAGYMQFTDWGSFYPKDYGFWLALISAILNQLFINYVLDKFWAPRNKE